MEKTPDGEESLKIIVKAPRPGGKKVPLKRRVGLQLRHDRLDRSPQPVRQKPDPELSSLSTQKEVLGMLMSQRCRGVLQNRISPLLSY